MNKKTILAILVLAFYVFGLISLASAVIVDAEYITLYPGEEGRINLDIENNENFDIEDVTITIDLSDLPFTSVGSSTKDVDDLDEDDDDSTSFTIRASTGITPGDYNIPYTIKYVDAADNDENFTDEGSFGVRVSARTDLDFSVEIRDIAIVGREGQVTLEIVNRGLGEIKSVSVQVFPQGFELLSSNKVFVGSIDADDSDTATFDIIYQSQSPRLFATVTYKDFDNNDQTEAINLPINVYTEQQALELGLISRSNTFLYVIIVAILIVAWFIWRRIRKNRQRKRKETSGR